MASCKVAAMPPLEEAVVTLDFSSPLPQAQRAAQAEIRNNASFIFFIYFPP